MPHYDYVCATCNHQEEVFQKITASVLNECPKCQNSTFKRKPGGGGGLLFYGTGFYETDYNAAVKQVGKDNSSKNCCPCGDNSSCSK